MNTYYKDQLSKVNCSPSDEFAAQIKITSNGKETNWISLYDESATALVEWTKENYNITESNERLVNIIAGLESLVLAVSKSTDNELITSEELKEAIILLIDNGITL